MEWSNPSPVRVRLSGCAARDSNPEPAAQETDSASVGTAACRPAGRPEGMRMELTAKISPVALRLRLAPAGGARSMSAVVNDGLDTIRTPAGTGPGIR